MRGSKATIALAEAISKHSPEGKRPSHAEALKLAESLRRLARRMHALAEAACSREMTAGERAEDEANDEAFRRLCASIGCGANINGDPRGYVAHIVFPDGAHNTWGGPESGWGID